MEKRTSRQFMRQWQWILWFKDNIVSAGKGDKHFILLSCPTITNVFISNKHSHKHTHAQLINRSLIYSLHRFIECEINKKKKILCAAIKNEIITNSSIIRKTIEWFRQSVFSNVDNSLESFSPVFDSKSVCRLIWIAQL